jgi:hypothetical protein
LSSRLLRILHYLNLQVLYDSRFLRFQVLIMNSYEQGKKARRIASVVYLLIMTIIMGGTYLSQQQKEAADKTMQDSTDH